MINILFVCHGNICRSPMAEYIFRSITALPDMSGKYYAESAAVSSEEIGNPVYPAAVSKLAQLGISCDKKRARQITKEDYSRFDRIVGADSSNVRRMLRFWGGDKDGKICRLLDFTQSPRDISDPWYTGNFDAAMSDIIQGCQGLLNYLEGQSAF